MNRLRNLCRDTRGSAAIEFVFAVPVLVMFVWGIFQISLVLEAQAGLQQALGEGARLATTFDTSTGAPPTTTQVQTQITSSEFGLGCSTCWKTPTIDTSNAASASGGYWVISVEYDMPTNFLFFTGPTIPLKQSKTVYLSE